MGHDYEYAKYISYERYGAEQTTRSNFRCFAPTPK